MKTFEEQIAEHRGSRPPRERQVEGVTFYSIYRGVLGSYWLARNGEHMATVNNRWTSYGSPNSNAHRDCETFGAVVDGVSIKNANNREKRFRDEGRALTAAAIELSRVAREASKST